MDRGVHTRTLQRAAELVGGKLELRQRLRVPMRELDDWLAGIAAPPTDIFLTAVDILSNLPAINDAALQLSVEAPHRSLRLCAAIEADRLREPTAEVRLGPLDFLAAEFAPGECRRVVEGAVYAAVRSAAADMGSLQLLCPDGLRLVAHEGIVPPALKYFELVTDVSSAPAQAARQGRRVVVADVDADPIYAGTDAARVMDEADIHALQATPIFSASGEVIAVLSTHYRKPRQPGERELAYIDEISARTAYWLERQPL